MKTLIKVRYDKLKYKEYITYNECKKSFDFGYPILDFVTANVKERYNNMIDSSKELENLFETSDTYLCKVFYGDDYKRLLKDEKHSKIKILLDDIEKKQMMYSTLINFTFFYNADKYSYDRWIDRFIFICNKLSYPIKQPRFSIITKSLDNNLNISNIDDNTLNSLDDEFLDYKVNNRNLNSSEGFIYSCENIDELFSLFMITIFERHYIISKCQNCNKYFVPFKKNDALYCDRISPQKDNKTCKEYASKQPKGLIELYRKIYMKKFARVNRNKDNFTYKNDFETWKETAEKLKSDYKKGIISDETFEKWLIDSDK